VRNRLITMGIALAAVTGLSACADAETVPRNAAHLTIDGNTHTTRPPACSQNDSYRTIDLRDRNGQVEAVVMLSGERVIPQWVKIRNVDGFTGSFWAGGVGEASAELAKRVYTVSGSAYGINSGNPNKVVTTGFKLTAEC
jgi:hypothetical protein